MNYTYCIILEMKVPFCFVRTEVHYYLTIWLFSLDCITKWYTFIFSYFPTRKENKHYVSILHYLFVKTLCCHPVKILLNIQSLTEMVRIACISNITETTYCFYYQWNGQDIVINLWTVNRNSKSYLFNVLN